MASLVSDPSTLTIAQIKQHLKEYNIPLPASDPKKGNLKKADYVLLYCTHLLRDRLEFSSDEEAVSTEPTQEKKPVEKVKKLRTKKPLKTKKMSAGSIDVTQLTDEELGQKLRELGADIGPILDTTRRVYQKKLERLLAGRVYEPPVISDSQDEYSDEDVADGIEEPVPEPETRSDVRELRKRPMTATTRTTTTTVTSRVEKTSEEVDATEKTNVNGSPATKSDQKVAQPRMSKWVQFGILVVVGVIIFLIFQNMEPAGKNPFTRITS